MQRLAFIIVCLVIIVPYAFGDNEQLEFNSQFISRTSQIRENNNENVVSDTVGRGRLFGIFINTTLYWQITESIDTYIADLESDGWQVVLYTAEGGIDYKEPDPNEWTKEDFLCELEAAEQLRELLQSEYDQGMVGCIFIGELPAIWYKYIEGGEEKIKAVDHFFRDLNSDWNDTDGDGQIDENTYKEGDYHPEIWMNRLYANSLDGDEVEFMENYFRKNHAYRIGELTLPKRALDYVDDDFACSGFFLRGLYDEITKVNDNQITTVRDYKERLVEGYELIRVTVHGSGPQHCFYDTPDFATAYAHCYVHSPIAQAVQLRLGADDSIKAWLNGIAICEFCRGSISDEVAMEEDSVDVHLDEGWNRLMLKIGDQSGNWRFSAKFTDVNGLDINNLSYCLNNLKDQLFFTSGYIHDWLINGWYENPDKETCLSEIDYLGGESLVSPGEGEWDGNKQWEAKSSETNDINLNNIFNNKTYIGYQEVVNIDPCCFFYDSYSCHTFHWWLKNYICGAYVFSHSYGLASWGPCDYGSTGIFYDVLDLGKCLGEAQLVHLNHLVTNNSYTGEQYGGFGMFGDPTLTIRKFPKSPTIIYVDGNVNGNNSGSSWENAYNNLQDALAEALWSTEIHVAQGTYWPDLGASFSLNNRNVTFQLKNGVVIKGGYAGFGAVDPNARDINLYETILSGEIGTSDDNDNSYHVVTASYVGTAAMLDGFTITGGHADANDNDVNNCGGGIYLSYSSTNIIDCNIINNYARYGGGILIQKVCSPTFEHCQLCKNSAIEGGGIANHSGPTFNNCLFSENEAQSKGGGIYNYYLCNPVMNDCNFADNSASQGGGIYSFHCSPMFANCKFINNSANYGGGLYNSASNSIITNCTIIGNSAQWGGAIVNNSSNPYLTNCTLSKNTGSAIRNYYNSHAVLTNCILWNDDPNEIYDRDNSSTVVLYSDIEGDWKGEGGFNINKDPNFADAENGDYHLKSQAGRWDPINKIWVQDDVNSPCIDAGNPNMDWMDEVWPHGKRINMGAYGGTSQASMSLSNIGDARDLNNDDLITWDDILLLIDNWDSNDIPLKEDLNLDGIVDINDLEFYKVNWAEDLNNITPAFDFIDDQYATVGELLSFSVTASDGDDNELVFIALDLPEDAEFSGEIFSWAPEQTGTYLITFIVSDYKSLDFMTLLIIVQAEQ